MGALLLSDQAGELILHVHVVITVEVGDAVDTLLRASAAPTPVYGA